MSIVYDIQLLLMVLVLRLVLGQAEINPCQGTEVVFLCMCKCVFVCVNVCVCVCVDNPTPGFEP